MSETPAAFLGLFFHQTMMKTAAMIAQARTAATTHITISVVPEVPFCVGSGNVLSLAESVGLRDAAVPRLRAWLVLVIDDGCGETVCCGDSVAHSVRDVSAVTTRQVLVPIAAELVLLIALKSKTQLMKVTFARNPVWTPMKKSKLFSWKTELTKTSVESTPMKTIPLGERHELLMTARHPTALRTICGSKSSRFPNPFPEKVEKHRKSRSKCPTQSAEPAIAASFWVQLSPMIEDGPENSIVFEWPAQKEIDESQSWTGERRTRPNELDLGVDDRKPIVSFIENHRQRLT
jgi:hypothetical protein